MGEKMYYIYKVINDSDQPIKGKEILVYLQQYGYDLNIKTIYSLIKIMISNQAHSIDSINT